MRLSFFDCVTDSAPQARDIPWKDFCDILHNAELVGDKRNAPCFSPAQYPDGAGRKAELVTHISLAVLDIDKISDDDLADLLDKLEPYATACYTTLSHPAKRAADTTQLTWALRVVVQLDAAVAAADWPVFWAKFNAFTGGHGDPACKDPSRLYILPAHYPKDPLPIVDINAGDPLPVATIMALPGPTTAPTASTATTGHRIDMGIIRHRASMLLRKKDHEPSAHLAHNLRALVNGKPYGLPGLRNASMLAMTWELDRLFPNVDVKAIVALFAPSHDAMTRDDPEPPDSLDLVERAVEGARAKRLARQAEQQNIFAQDRQGHIEDVRGDGDAHAYTDDELNSIARAHGIPRNKLKRHWILRNGGQLYFLTLQGYTEGHPQQLVLSTAEHYLSPANLNLRQVMPDKSGRRPYFKLDDILHDYSAEATRVVCDLRATFSRFNYHTRDLHIASAPRAELEPTEHPQIHEWLTLLGGNHADKFLSWVACAPDMDKHLCAIYLAGAPGVGKTVFATALSRIWKRGTPTPFATAVGRFNRDLAECPLVLVDEGFPAMPPKQIAIELRALIGSDEVRVEHKHGGSFKLIGPRRLVMAANNTSLLDFKSELTHDDIEALAVRILQIEPNVRARDVFTNLPHEEIQAWKSHKIAEHALWLQENMTVTYAPGSRFWVQGELDDSMRHVLTDGYFTSLACQVLVKVITDPKRRHQRDDLIRPGNGELLVNQEGLNMAWIEALPNIKPPVKMASVLRSLVKRRKESLNLRVAGLRRRFWPIDLDTLSKWCNDNGYVSEDIVKIINEPGLRLVGTDG